MAEPGESPPPMDEQEVAQSQEALSRGALPVEAQRRLAQESGARPLFVADLSFDEFLLARSEGFEAAGQVMGSSIYHVGWQFRNWTGELTTLTQAHMEARRLALTRMQEEATALRAHGVIGVRLEAKAYDWGPDLLEFAATGTAVRLRGAPLPSVPFLSDLSGSDFWTLVRAGYVPRGLAMGFCSYFVYTTGRVSWYNNQELTNFTAGVYEARNLAMQRLRAELPRLGAEGVVGVKVEANARPSRPSDNSPLHLYVDFLALGTAVVRHAAPQPIPPPLRIMNLSGLSPLRSRLAASELAT